MSISVIFYLKSNLHSVFSPSDLSILEYGSKPDCPSGLVGGDIDRGKSQLQLFNFTDVYVRRL